MYDLRIINGLILDGTGSAPYRADVVVSQGDIVAIGYLEGPAQHTIDAGRLAVAPGFIALHTHSDMSFLLDPTAQSKVRQGVTLELAGNCGSSFCAPLQGETRDMLQAPGYAADLVVFDPDTIADTATFEAPHSYPTGVTHVAVNGVLVVENGAFTGRTPGKVIRDFAD